MSNDLEPLMATISLDAPSGVDLEYDPDFSRMEKAAQGTPDQEYGSTKIEGTPADWEEVLDAATSILTRSRDLRAATYWAEAQLFLSGITGFRDGLELLSVYVDQFWDTVFPRLDEDDDNDPTIRINSLAGLTKVSGIIRELRLTPILSARSVGRFSWTDCAIAKGEIPVPAGMESPPTQKKVDAAVMACDATEFNETVRAVEECIEFANKIESSFSDRLGPAIGPNLEALLKELKSIAKYQKVWVASRSQNAPEEPQNVLVTTAMTTVDAVSPTQAVQVIREPFAITRREDVIEGLDKIIAWLERNEPSSPLPMLLRRAKRLSTMSFLDILRDISPDGVSQAVVIGGREAERDLSDGDRQDASESSSPNRIDPNDY